MGAGTKTGSLLTRGIGWNKELGKKAIPGLGNYFQKRANKKITEAGFEGITPLKTMTLGAVEGAFPLAYYEGAMGYVQAKINNQDPDMEYQDPVWALTHGFLHGGALGAVTGGVTRGIMSKKQSLLSKGKGKIKKETLRKLPIRNWPSEIGKRFISKAGTAPGTIGVESLIFSGVATAEHIGTMEDPRFGEIMLHFG